MGVTTPSLIVRNESNTETEVKTNVSFIVKVLLPAAVHYVQQMLKVFIDSLMPAKIFESIHYGGEVRRTIMQKNRWTREHLHFSANCFFCRFINQITLYIYANIGN